MSQAQLTEQAKAHAVILSVCSWCEEVYGGGAIDPEFAGLSHGICPRCHAAYYASNPDLAARRSARLAAEQ